MSDPQQQHPPAQGAALEQPGWQKGVWGGHGHVDGWIKKLGTLVSRRIVFLFGGFKCLSPVEAQETTAMPAAQRCALSGSSAANTRKVFHFTWEHLSVFHKDRSSLACLVVQIQSTSK